MSSGNHMVDAEDKECYKERKRKKEEDRENNWEDYWEPGDE